MSLDQEPIMSSMHNSWHSLLWQTELNKLAYSEVLVLNLLIGFMP
jgi:hypothetical protein